MAYIENPFKVGQLVICINENFPVVATTLEDKSIIGTITKNHPKEGEQLEIDEILGEFLRFSMYDEETCYNWWMHTHFKILEDLTDEEHTEYVVHKNVKLFNELRKQNQLP